MVPGTRPTQTLKQNATSYLSALASRNHRCVQRLWPFNHRRNKTQSVTHAMVYKNLAVKPALFLFQASFWVRQCTPTVAKHLFEHNATDSDTRGRMCICIYVHTICSTYVFSLYVYTYSWLTYLQTYTHMHVGHWNSEHLVRRRILANRYNWFMMEVKDECSQPEAS